MNPARAKDMKRSLSFGEIKDAVTQEVIQVASDFGLVKQFFFPLLRQQELLEHYPLIVTSLYRAVTGNILMGLCRLFEADANPRLACLKTFLDYLRTGSGMMPKEYAGAEERRRKYLEQFGQFDREISAANKRLAVQRSAYWAHSDLTKRDRELPIKWEELEQFIELAQKILREYYSAYENVDQRFEVVDLGWEPEGFLKWCRLDDYAAHRKKELEEQVRQFRQRVERNE